MSSTDAISTSDPGEAPDPHRGAPIHSIAGGRAEIATVVVIVAAALIGMLSWTWSTWADPTVDFGTQLYVPWRITLGDALYGDLAYYKGPLSPYFNALLFTLLGTSLRTLVIANLVILALTLVLLWRLLRGFTDELAAGACLLGVVFVFAFLQYRYFGNFNWITPYAHEYTHGVALSLGALLAVRSYACTARARHLVQAGLLTGLVFLTTAEVCAACAIAVSTGLLLAFRQHQLRLGAALKDAAVLGGCALAMPLVAWIALSLQMPMAQALRGTLGSWMWVFDPRIAELGFYRASMGLDDPQQRLARILVILAGEFAFFGVAFVIAWMIPKLSWRLPARMATVAVAVVIGALLAWNWPHSIAWNELALPLPVYVLAIIGVSALRCRRRHEKRDAARLVFAIFALVLLGKMALFARVQHYGFTLALPATMLVIEALLGAIPSAIEQRGRAGKTFRAIALLALSAYVVGIVYGHHLFSHDKTIAVGAGADRFLADARGEQVNAALRLLDQQARPGDTLAVLPQGLMLNYLARRAHPNAHLNFMPPEVISAGEQTIVAAYDAHPPDWIILARVNVRGDAFYLLDGDYAYGRAMLKWVQDRYEVVAIIPGPWNDPTAQWLVMRRAGSVPGRE